MEGKAVQALTPAAAADDNEKAAEAGEKVTRTKKKKKLVTVPMSQEKVDRLLSLPERTRPFPVMSEEQLAVIADPAKREELREVIARVAEHYYQSREEIKREQDLIREEIATLGYAKGVMEVTDDEDEEEEK
ncbi:hypothetical protein ACP70R_027377 [Stipagrostis hirtigluma subsp. patula]